MNKFIASLCALVALVGLAASPVVAQPAPKILIVDMAKLLDAHHKTEEQNAKLKGDEARANDELEKINREGQALVDQLKKMEEDAKNPALSTSAREQLQTEMRTKVEEIQKKQNEVQSFRNNTQRSLQQRIQNFRKLMFEEITATVNEVAKKKGATLVLDKSGPSLIGINPIVYADAAYDITEEVQKEINKGRPAAAAAPASRPATAPAAPAAPAAESGARVNFPGTGR
jgi:outer membrane protein